MQDAPENTYEGFTYLTDGHFEWLQLIPGDASKNIRLFLQPTPLSFGILQRHLSSF